MPDDLQEIRERLDHVDHKITQFRLDCQSFVKTAITTRFEAEAGGRTFCAYYTQKTPVPTSIKSDCGMLANEIRSCLDSLACVLANRNGNSSTQTYFPISKSKEIFLEDGLGRKLKKLSDSDKIKIQSVAPWQGGDKLLWSLHEADRIKKHVRLVALSGINSDLSIPPIFHLDDCRGIITFDNIRISGISPFDIHIEHLEVMCFDKNRLSIGTEYPLYKGMPKDIFPKLSYSVLYSEPQALEGCNAPNKLNAFLHRVREIVSMF